MFTIPAFSRTHFDELFTELDRLSRGGTPAVPVSIWSGEDAVAVTVEVPGVTKEDLAIEVTADTLTISGARKPVATDGAWLGRERGAGRFERSIALPWRVDPDKVEARLADGVLTIAVQRADSDKPRKIPVAA